MEDEPSDIDLVVAALRQAGFDPSYEVVQTPEEFSTILREHAWDVILADYKLPQWNGMESVEILQREGWDIPVIVVSGSLGEQTAVECIKKAAADYVLKGITGLSSLVKEVICDLKPELEGRQIEWKLAELPYVVCDSGLLKQVLQNLIANAVKFTRPRAQAVIEVGQQENNGVPVIFVRDNGVGFSMKYADKLFGVFQRLHRPEDFEGTGVGLATVQRIIQKHGGRIWAEAELDKGATFYFTIGRSERSTHKSKAAIVGDPQ